MRHDSTGAVETPSGDAGVVSQKSSAASAAPTHAAPQIVCRPIAELDPYANNSRTHSAEQVEQVAASIIEFGWTVPVLVDAQGVVAGHARLEAAHRLYEEFGCTLEFPDGTPIPRGMVPTISCDGWNDARRRAYVIADNQLALNAGWDDAVLKSEWDAIGDDFQRDVIGFDDDTMTVLSGGFVKPPSHPVNDIERNTLLIEFGSERDLQAAFTELQARGWSVKIMS